MEYRAVLMEYWALLEDRALLMNYRALFVERYGCFNSIEGSVDGIEPFAQAMCVAVYTLFRLYSVIYIYITQKSTALCTYI